MAVALSSLASRDLQGNITALAAGALSTRILRIAGGASGVLLVAGANATTVASQQGPLFYLSEAVKGGSTALLGEAVQVSALRAITDATVCTNPVLAGQPMYLTDAGAVDNVAGTIPRRVGTVLAVIDAGARTVTWLFDGSLASKHLTEETGGTAFLAGLSVLNGQLQLRVREVTIADGDTAAATATDCVVAILRSPVAGAARTLTLPATPSQGQLLIVKDADASAVASNIVLDGNGYLMDGDATATLNVNGVSGTLVFSGSRWLRTVLFP